LQIVDEYGKTFQIFITLNVLSKTITRKNKKTVHI